MAVPVREVERLESMQEQQERLRRVREAKKFQARLKQREGFRNHVKGIEKLMALKNVVPTRYLKKEDK